ncbi:Cell division protein SepF [Metalysinibacillus saudimassiliensis]|uniref:Cell division protein SepF n=1 Tax=Metalysinibacillus saudimassiliensis TaxID=1461583 RepID=A0A078M8L6_9BACL|nr:Cell division protein SepF [Metalysinibacillus saudimassiliensis]
MTKKSKWKSFFYGDEEFEELDATPEPQQPANFQMQQQMQQQRPRVVKPQHTNDGNNVVKLQAVPNHHQQHTPKVRVFEPNSYAEVQAISDCIRDEQTVVINIHLLDSKQAKRVIDFIGGATYVMGATFKKISTDVFLSSPANVEIEGDVQQLLTNQTTE